MDRTPQLKLVIFDCDGVLVDSEAIAARVFAEVLGETGLNLSPVEVDRRFRGKSLKDCLDQVERSIGGKLPQNFLTQLNERTYEAFRADLRPIPGVRQVVETLRDAGISTCVASSGSHEKMNLTLAVTGLLPLLQGRLFSATQVARGKPAPDLLQLAATTMGATAGESVVIEDSNVGAQGARAAGMRVYGFVDEQACDRSPLQKARARAAFGDLDVPTFGRMSELPGLLGL